MRTGTIGYYFELNTPNPAIIFLTSTIGYAILWLIAPIDINHYATLQELIYSISLPILFALGLLLGHRRINSSSNIVFINLARLRRTVGLLALAGFIGLSIQAYERLYLRAGGMATLDFMSNRELIATGGSGALALLGGVLSSLLLFIPFLAMLLRASGGSGRIHWAMISLSLMPALFQLIFQGSRSLLVIYVGIYIASALATGTKKPNRRTILAAITLGVALIWLFGQVFAIRISQLGISPIDSMQTSIYSDLAPASANVIQYLEQHSLTGFGGLIYAYTHATQYLLHGYLELLYALSNLSSGTTNGLQTFYIPLKIYYSMTGKGDIETTIHDGLLRPGVYTTLFGPLLYDFGFVGAVIASFMFGLGAGFVSRLVSRGHTSLLPLNLVTQGFLPFALVVNLYTSGFGQYALIASVLLGLILLLRQFRFILRTPSHQPKPQPALPQGFT